MWSRKHSIMRAIILMAVVIVVGCSKRSETTTSKSKKTAGKSTDPFGSINIVFSGDTLRIDGKDVSPQELSKKITNWCRCDLIVGPKGSTEQLFLSSVARTTAPAEVIPWLYYEQLKSHKMVKSAIPIARADTTKKGGYPVVGTTKEYFTAPFPGAATPRLRLQAGHGLFAKTLDAIIGSEVAERNRWKLGTKIQLLHAGIADHEHDEDFTVAGIMEKTSSPDDRTVFISLDGFYTIAQHGLPEEEMKNQLEGFFGKKYTADEWSALRKKNHAFGRVTSVRIIARRPPDDPAADATPTAFLLESVINKGRMASAMKPGTAGIELILRLKQLAVFLRDPDAGSEP